MKTLQAVLAEQKHEVSIYRKVAKDAVNHFCRPNSAIVGGLLSGSTARGDARKGPFGFMIDLIVVVEDRNAINMEEVFGPDREPYIPYHCIKYEDIGLKIELATIEDLRIIRTKSEAEIFAKQEADILIDKTGFLKRWKHETFGITPEEKRNRALMQFYRFEYLTNSYHQEKWTNREAWIQLAQNGNEACECYCCFLYCINGWFIPRRDWLVYLIYILKYKADGHERLIDESYCSELTREGILRRYKALEVLGKWMKEFCRKEKWIA